METNARYALHDCEAAPPVWAARVRLTPELLQKLRQKPEHVALRLNVPVCDGASTTRGSNRKTSVMTLNTASECAGENTEEQYELLSFEENPNINYVCTFRRDAGESICGFNVYKTGAIHQKLLVQRLLDATEKGRIKDKHAKSVLESKSRASKLINSKVAKPTKRQRLTSSSKRSNVRTSLSLSCGALSKIVDSKQTCVLLSALSSTDADKIKEQIEKKSNADAEEALSNEKGVETNNGESEELIAPAISTIIATAAREEKSHESNPSKLDKDGTGIGQRCFKRTSAKAAKKVDTFVVTGKREQHQSTLAADVQGESAFNSISRPKEAEYKTTETRNNNQRAKGELDAVEAKDVKVKQHSNSLKIATLPNSGPEVKRARVRSALVSDRVKQARLPDLSFLPPTIKQICERLANYHGRSVILDVNDYDSFVETHEQFQRDWQLLDKAYSIMMIKIEGEHLRAELASHSSALQPVIEASSCKRESLLFVRDAMVSIQKILTSIQFSIDRFDVTHDSTNTPT
ncbi:hypothetical protein CCR75_005023 [Bremia lactucae]|uniref:Uncharacterized protein n=1 Tax=Bremia lactucae TaxID=4779 RepID=A0A976IF54_BRELC|nr:hypothetical protein CCR75_005023 [Bremia lactucae]